MIQEFQLSGHSPFIIYRVKKLGCSWSSGLHCGASSLYVMHCIAIYRFQITPWLTSYSQNVYTKGFWQACHHPIICYLRNKQISFPFVNICECLLGHCPFCVQDAVNSWLLKFWYIYQITQIPPMSHDIGKFLHSNITSHSSHNSWIPQSFCGFIATVLNE